MHALHRVLQLFFSPQGFRVALPDVWAGFQVNLKMMVVSEALVLVFALGIAVVRGLPGRGLAPARALAIVYTDVFPGRPRTIATSSASTRTSSSAITISLMFV